MYLLTYLPGYLSSSRKMAQAESQPHVGLITTDLPNLVHAFIHTSPGREVER